MKTKMEDYIEWMTLCNVKGIGSSKIIKLISIFGDVKNIYKAGNEGLLKTRVFKESMVEEYARLKKEDSNYFRYIFNECEKKKIKIIHFYSKEYPPNLKLMPDAPLTLFAWGDTTLLKCKKIAIVGSRESSEEAKRWAFELSQKIAKEKIIIVSGGAKGIDYEAHRGVLSVGGKTICVLGSGLFKLYPEEHRQLFEEIKENGLLLSEQLPNENGGRLSLLRRNRIISGISDSLVLVSSSSEGGSLAQLKIAHMQRVPIFCPSPSLNLLPNDGIKEAIRDYGAKEIRDATPLLKKTTTPTLLAFS